MGKWQKSMIIPVFICLFLLGSLVIYGELLSDAVIMSDEEYSRQAQELVISGELL